MYGVNEARIKTYGDYSVSEKQIETKAVVRPNISGRHTSHFIKILHIVSYIIFYQCGTTQKISFKR